MRLLFFCCVMPSSLLNSHSLAYIFTHTTANLSNPGPPYPHQSPSIQSTPQRSARSGLNDRSSSPVPSTAPPAHQGGGRTPKNERDQKRREDLRDGFERLKDALCVSDQRLTQLDVLDCGEYIIYSSFCSRAPMFPAIRATVGLSPSSCLGRCPAS